MQFTCHSDSDPHVPVSTANASEAGGASEIEITSEMLRAGADCLGEFTRPGGLENSLTYVVAAVYRAMEKQKPETLECQRQSSDC